MNGRFAFRLCGELVDTGVRIARAAKAGSTVLAGIEAAIELIDAAGSAVRYFQQRDRNQIRQEAVGFAEDYYENKKQVKQEESERLADLETQKSLQRLEQLRITLTREKNQMRQDQEAAARDLRVSVEWQARVSAHRGYFKEAIDLVTKQLDRMREAEGMNRGVVADLEEQLRQAVGQYNKIVQLCC